MTTEILNKEQQLAVAFFESKLAFETGPVSLKMALESGEKLQIIDLRKAELYEKGHIKAAVNVSYDELEAYLPKLDKETTTVVYCYDELCNLSARAALLLAKKGYKVKELAGGFDGWAERKFEIVGQTHKSSCSASSCG